MNYRPAAFASLSQRLRIVEAGDYGLGACRQAFDRAGRANQAAQAEAMCGKFVRDMSSDKSGRTGDEDAVIDEGILL
jgi:hypothetical protein